MNLLPGTPQNTKLATNHIRRSRSLFIDRSKSLKEPAGSRLWGYWPFQRVNVWLGSGVRRYAAETRRSSFARR
jgi:hypothetical protein